MDIFSNDKFVVLPVGDDNYVFYNSTLHYAIRLDKFSLSILDLVYTYKDIEYILSNIKPEHHYLVKQLYDDIENSNILTIADDGQTIDFSLSQQIPSQYYIHLTNRCNLKCVYCYNKDVRSDYTDLKLNEWIAILDQILPHAKSILLTGGEPFLHKNMGEIVLYIKKFKPDIYLEVLSNCMHDFNSGLYDSILANISSISFSCDSVTHVLERINFNPKLFKDNISYIKKKFPQLLVTLSTTITQKGKNHIQDILQFSNKNECNSKLTIVVPNNEDEIVLLPSLTEFSERTKGNRYPTKLSRKDFFCGAGFTLCSIDALGNLYPCQNMHYQPFHLGNLLNDDFLTIYNSKRTRELRANPSILNIDTCSSCNLKYLCTAGCRAATYRLEGDVNSFPKTMCEYYKRIALAKLSSVKGA